jgi:crotonobetainyl-CoA:carnitine CoA-transferase CaiB-like acyl-CoA transferase
MTLFSAPYESFNTNDGAVLIVASNDRLFANVCQALGMPELANDERFRSNTLRIREPNRSELHAILESRTSTMTSDACVEVMRQAGAPCSTINTVDAVCRDPQVDAMRMIRHFPTAENPDLKLVDIPVSIDGEKASLRRPPPGLGQHTEEVLAENGYSPADIEKLRRDRIVA